MDYRLRREYGITSVEYDRRLEEQDGVCAICKRDARGWTLAVDHSHQTGQIRGLLCPGCNRTLGYLDNAAWLTAAKAYLGWA
jgi:hypothetical protein